MRGTGKAKIRFVMPAKPVPSRLHGNIADRSRVALLLVDVINSFEFPGAESLMTTALPAAVCLGRLRRAARKSHVPVIYANDNFGRWRSDFRETVDFCLRKRGAPIVRKLLPTKNDYFVLKPKNSAFYTTTLDLLLQHIGVRTLIIAGFAADNCLLFTSNDAYLRNYRIIIPQDATAAEDIERKERALLQMKGMLKAKITDTGKLLRRWPKS